MDRIDMIRKLAKDLVQPQSVVRAVLEGAGDIIVEALTGGEEISLPRLGIFKSKDRAAKVGVNPQTRKPLQIPAHRVVAFRPFSTLKAAINEEGD